MIKHKMDINEQGFTRLCCNNYLFLNILQKGGGDLFFNEYKSLFVYLLCSNTLVWGA